MAETEVTLGETEDVDEDADKMVGSNSVRWIMLAIYGGISFCNGMLWITFSPITTFTEAFFDIDANLVNLLSVVYMVLYIPGSVFASWLYKHYGCRTTLLFAATGNAVSAWTRVVAVAQPDKGYVFLLLGQCIGSWVQPSLLNAPAKITAVWFTIKERDMATAVGKSSLRSTGKDFALLTLCELHSYFFEPTGRCHWNPYTVVLRGRRIARDDSSAAPRSRNLLRHLRRGVYLL